MYTGVKQQQQQQQQQHYCFIQITPSNNNNNNNNNHSQQCPSIAKLLTPPQRALLLPLVRGWLDDRSHWVRDATLELLGRVLVLLPAEDIPQGV